MIASYLFVYLLASRTELVHFEKGKNIFVLLDIFTAIVKFLFKFLVLRPFVGPLLLQTKKRSPTQLFLK